MSSIVKENYLKALYFLHQQNDLINVTELSKSLGVSKPTANNMIRTFEDQGWVIYQKYKPIRLTEKGRKAAARVIRKHRLTEMFLHKIMGFGWEEVHEIAEQIEHIDSTTFFDRMDEMLGHPSIDPHGSPIPDLNGEVVVQNLHPLTALEPGQSGRLMALANSSTELLHHLNAKKIQLGMSIRLLQIDPYDENCAVSCDGGADMIISKKVGESLLVKVF